VLHRSATNDFHGWMDDVYRTNALIPNQLTRYSWVPHMNHRLTPEVAITMPLWFDQHLKGGPALPETPQSELRLKSNDDVPMLRVRPDAKSLPVARVEIFYSTDPDPRARFWRSAEVVKEAEGYIAQLPDPHARSAALRLRERLPHAAQARIARADPRQHQTDHRALPQQPFPLAQRRRGRASEPKLTAKSSTIIDDFTHGTRDWYVLNAGNATHQQLWTRKVTDPLWRGPEGSKLQITLKLPQIRTALASSSSKTNGAATAGPRRTFVCPAPKSKAPMLHKPSALALSDFTSAERSPTNWSEIDQLGLCANHGLPANEVPLWKGPAPEFLRVAWE